MGLVERLHDRRGNPAAFGDLEPVLPSPLPDRLILITV
jgi:hypothetical protein